MLQIGLITQQYNGLLDGYLTTAISDVHTKYNATRMEWDLQLINNLGDLFDIKPTVVSEQRTTITHIQVQRIIFTRLPPVATSLLAAEPAPKGFREDGTRRSV